MEEVATQEAGGEEQYFQILDLAGGGIQSRHHVVAEFLGFLLRVRRALIDMQDVSLTVVLEG